MSHTLERPLSFSDAAILYPSSEQYALEQACYEYWVDAQRVLSIYFKGETIPFGFLKTLGECLVKKVEWAEDLVYQADLTDVQVAALKGESYIRDYFADQDYND